MTGDTTDKDGSVVVEQQFSTSATNTRPEMKAHLRSTCVMVRAQGYGTVIVPVCTQSVPTQWLRDEKELLVPIGLLPVK